MDDRWDSEQIPSCLAPKTTNNRGVIYAVALLLLQPDYSPYCVLQAKREETSISPKGRRVVDTYRVQRNNERLIIHVDHPRILFGQLPRPYDAGDTVSVRVEVHGREITIGEKDIRLVSHPRSSTGL